MKRPPTEKKVQYAHGLTGKPVEELRGMDYTEVDVLIDEAKGQQPATAKQLAYARDLGIPEEQLTGRSTLDVSMLIRERLKQRDAEERASIAIRRKQQFSKFPIGTRVRYTKAGAKNCGREGVVTAHGPVNLTIQFDDGKRFPIPSTTFLEKI